MTLAPQSFLDRLQKIQITLPSLILFACVCTVFWFSLQRQTHETTLRIQSSANDLAQKIMERLQRSEHVLTAYSAFINSVPDYNQQQFNQFSAIMIANESALFGIGWTQIIPHQQRENVEQTFRDAGYPDYHFTQLTTQGQLIMAEPQPEYYPVLYIYPFEANRRAFGLNLGANPDRKAALLKAKQLGKPVATAPIILAQETQQQKATILYRPIFDHASGDFIGYVSGVMRIESILGDMLSTLENAGFSIILTDQTDPQQAQDLIRQSGQAIAGFEPNRYQTVFGERNYQIELVANQTYPVADKDWISWILLTTGFLIAALAEIFIMTMTGSHAHIRREVAAKTKDLRIQTKRANEASRAKTEFLANMSHELRTPLNAIIGLINLCLKTQLTTQQLDYLQKASLSSSTLLSLINQTLDHAKIEAGRMELNTEAVSLSHILHKLLAVFELTAQQKGIRFECVVAPNVPEQVIGDSLRIEQILLNLLGNAFKFTDQGGVTLFLSFRNPDFIFKICDTGLGISAEYRQNLFSAFSQEDASTSRRYGGTGLGLSISYQLAQLMGGQLELLETDMQGSCFSVRLPLQIAENSVMIATPLQQEATTEKTNTAPVADTKPLQGKTTLLAEDIQLNQLIASEILKDFGADVIIANNGEEAIQALMACDSIDLTLMDIQMPVMDGYVATKHIRALPHYAQHPILAMTANALDQDIQHCLDAGMNAHISKPIDAQLLLEKIQKYLASTEE